MVDNLSNFTGENNVVSGQFFIGQSAIMDTNFNSVGHSISLGIEGSGSISRSQTRILWSTNPDLMPKSNGPVKNRKHGR